MSKTVKRVLFAVVVVAVVGAGLCAACRWHRKHWSHWRHEAESRQGQLLGQLCPDPKVKGDFYQAAAVLQVGKDVDPLPVACRLASEACVRKAVGPTESETLLRSRMKVRMVEGGSARLIVVYVGGFDSPDKARQAAGAVARACVDLAAGEQAARRQGEIEAVVGQIDILKGLMETRRKEANEIRREAASPQLAERQGVLSDRLSYEQKEMLANTLQAEELARSLEALKKIAETKDLRSVPELLKRVAENEELRTIRAEILKRQLELAESKGAGEAAEKVQGMEKRLAGLEGLLKQASDRVLAQALADYQRDLETELGKVRSRSMKIATVYREDQAAARDGVERLSILADRTQELDDLRQKLARLDDKLRDLRISAQAAEPPVRILDTYLLSPHNPSPTTKPDK